MSFEACAEKIIFLILAIRDQLCFTPAKACLSSTGLPAFSMTIARCCHCPNGYWPTIQTMTSKNMDGEFAGFI
jgi:hypothetical protein